MHVGRLHAEHGLVAFLGSSIEASVLFYFLPLASLRGVCAYVALERVLDFLL